MFNNVAGLCGLWPTVIIVGHNLLFIFGWFILLRKLLRATAKWVTVKLASDYTGKLRALFCFVFNNASCFVIAEFGQ